MPFLITTGFIWFEDEVSNTLLVTSQQVWAPAKHIHMCICVDLVKAFMFA